MRLPGNITAGVLSIPVGLLFLSLLTGCSTPNTGAVQAGNPQANTLVQEGIRLAEGGELDKALAVLDRAVEMDPQIALKAFAYSWRGYCYRHKGNLEQALAEANRQLESDDQQNRAYFLAARGYIYMDLHDPNHAIADYTQAITLRPSTDSFYNSRGLAYAEKQQWNEAIADFTRALNAADPAAVARVCGSQWQSDALWQRGHAYLRLGNQEAARADALRAKDLLPRRVLAFGEDNLFEYLDPDKRVKVAAEAVAAGAKAEAEGNLLAAFQAYQRAYGWGAQFGDVTNQAVAGMRRLYPKLPARPTIPEEVRRFAVQADTAAGEQKYDEAIVLYDKALDATPWWPKGRYNLAMLKAQKNDFAGAIAEMEQYLALAPGAPDAREAKDLVYQWQYKQQSRTGK